MELLGADAPKELDDALSLAAMCQVTVSEMVLYSLLVDKDKAMTPAIRKDRLKKRVDKLAVFEKTYTRPIRAQVCGVIMNAAVACIMGTS